MAKKTLDSTTRKLQPKLRMIANGSTVVNAIRAEHSPALAVCGATWQQLPMQRGYDAVPVTRSALPKKGRVGHLKRVSSAVEVNVFVQTNDLGVGLSSRLDGKKARKKRMLHIPGESLRKGNQIIATVKLDQLSKIAAHERVAFVELGEGVVAPTPVVSPTRSAPPAGDRRIESAVAHHSGKGVLIGIIDVMGFDFAHEDFLDADGRTRFVRIWDQGGDARPSPKSAGLSAFNYGAEFRQEHLNAAIKAAPKLGVRPVDVERQSQMDEGSHGTHVASIAAGNRGICPRAAIAGVLIALPNDDLKRRRSFYDSTRIVHAVEYLLAVADDLGRQSGGGPWPVSINISLGTNGHAHDASAAASRWIDSALAVPGRGVCVAAGNAGQQVSEFEGDYGWVMGRIHTSGRVPTRGLDADLDWVVVGNGISDISENELEIWYSPQDRFAVSIRPPGGEWIGPVEPQRFLENRQLKDGSFLSVYNELYHPSNGANYLAIYLSPLLSDRGVVGVAAGTWTIRLHGREVRDGRFHGWIERDDPHELGRVGDRKAWRFPSFFSQRSNVDDSSVSSLACGHRIVSVANLDEAKEKVNISSSQGPTRDGRCKPDAAAPGTDIVAAKGFSGPEDPWVSMSGTSMASPYVAGVVGLMLAVEPSLTAAQINGIIQRTAKPLPGASFDWRNDAGFGRIDPAACLAEAQMVNQRKDLT